MRCMARKKQTQTYSTLSDYLITQSMSVISAWIAEIPAPWMALSLTSMALDTRFLEGYDELCKLRKSKTILDTGKHCWFFTVSLREEWGEGIQESAIHDCLHCII